MNKLSLKDLVMEALIAATYAILVFVPFLYNLGYGAIQFRVAEALLVLVLFNRKHAIGLLLGTFVVNMFNPDVFGLADALFGTLTSAIAIYLMILTKQKPLLSVIFPIILNGLYVAGLLYVMLQLPFWYNVLTVGVGEAVVMIVIGLPLYYALVNNKSIKELLEQ